MTSTAFASALQEGQSAHLDLGELSFAAVVIGFADAEVALAVTSPAIGETLAASTVGYLMLDTEAGTYGLKVTVRRGSQDGELIATLKDPFRLGQRRNASRAPIFLPVTLQAVGDATDPCKTFTRDVCADGLRIARQPTYREATSHEMVIGVVHADREIDAQAVPVRVTASDIALRFTAIRAEDRALLSDLTLAYHRRVATARPGNV